MAPGGCIAMSTLFEIVKPILLIFGSISVAIVLCWVLWRGFKLIHHPEWAAIAAVLAGVLALHATAPHPFFYRMVIIFTLVGAVPLWVEGRAWRRARTRPIFEPEPTHDVAPTPSDPPRRYPIIIACIGEGRPPKQEEVRAVAARIWREGLRQRAVSQTPAGSFAMRRSVFKVAEAALIGQADKRVLRRRPGNDL